MAPFVKAANISDILPGQAKTVDLQGHKIALFNVGGTFYATENPCLHRGGPLGQGHLEGARVTCPWHGWQFDVTTGACELNPEEHLATYPVKVEGQEIFVGL